jgi:ABC-2 type transport system permease protein
MNEVKIIASHFLKTTIRSSALKMIYSVWLLLVIFAAFTGYRTYTSRNAMLTKFQQDARRSWEANPDKHPHRMAHFGSFAFRLKHPMSMFDYGMESYTGNAVFLEAHRQNTANFSEAGFSTGLLRFGEISLSMLIQILLPLILFFLGFNSISQQKENGTLKILLSQGAGFITIICANSLGLFLLSILFLAPVILVTIFQLALTNLPADSASFLRSGIILLLLLAFMWLICVIAVSISALSNNSRSSLLKLLGIWLLMAIVLPKTLQAIGSALHPAPGKIEFDMAVEKDILNIGDSHNPDDPHFKVLRDSILKANHVDSVQKLSFNYGGFQMREGERLSAEVYAKRVRQLYNTYEQQNSISNYAAFVDPFIGMKNIIMALSGSDFKAYRHFQDEAETYRYNLAQTMNELQMKYIGNGKDDHAKPQIIGRDHWTAFPDFHNTYQSVRAVLAQQLQELIAILLWFVLSFVFIYFTAASAKAI